MNALETFIAERIKSKGAMPVDEFIATALGHEHYGYYIKQDPFGKDGDFTTAPEISQLFGEMIANYIAQSWFAYGTPNNFEIYELGPGRGTLMDDVLRTLKTIAEPLYKNLKVYLIDMSPTLIAKQQDKLRPHSNVKWVNRLPDTVKNPFCVIGNEFFDALPVKQFEKIDGQWHERTVILEDDQFAFSSKPSLTPPIPNEFAHNLFYEHNEFAESTIKKIADYKKNAPGGALFIDYGYLTHTGLKDTLQALKNHDYQSPLLNVGEQDITTHVNFSRLLDLMKHYKLDGNCVFQRDFLRTMGIIERAQQLVNKAPDKQDEINISLHRLLGDEEMGQLFKVLMIG